jgi:hypothetical protein
LRAAVKLSSEAQNRIGAAWHSSAPVGQSDICRLER